MDQISADNLTQDAPPDEEEATHTAHRTRNRRKEEDRVHAAERARLPPRNLNNEFNNVADPVFRTPIAAMTEATLRLMKMPQNPEMEHVIHLAKNAVEQLERQNPLSSLHGTRSRATATVIPGGSRSYEQVTLLEAIIDNNSWRSKIKETRRIEKLQVTIDPGQTKPLDLSQIATTTTAGATRRK